ncbi:MAG TPA: alcohol dehydrogenase catalytic domain-containing protein [Phycisphaerae bacterium]|nr:alcohol dehydrogenase catalytic domain-containing protein [Phycisphaerae bacterium]
MQAILVEAGKVDLREVPQPKAGKGEVLVKVRLAGICGTDLEILRGYADFQGVLGHEFVGTVIAGSTSLEGKRVVGEINCVCGRCDMCASGLSGHCRKRTVLGIAGRDGAFAEYVMLPERNCLEVPPGVSDEEAVFTEPLAAAYQVVRQVKIEPRMSVIVLGTGRLGLLVAQVLAQTGCRLTAVGRNPKTLGLLDRKRIRTATVDETHRNQDHDLVVDCTGSPEGLGIALGLVRPRGTIVLKTTCLMKGDVDLAQAVVNEVTILGSRCGPFGEALNALARKQVEVASMVTHVVPLAEGVKALRLAGEPDQVKVLLKVGE